jgi:hypothetical protein
MWSDLLSRMAIILALRSGDRRGGAAEEPGLDDLRSMRHAYAAFDRPSEHWLPSGSEDIPLHCLQYGRLTALVSLATPFRLFSLPRQRTMLAGRHLATQNSESWSILTSPVAMS